MAVPRRVIKPMPLKGRYTSAPADAIGPEYSPNALNVRFRFGEVKPGPGRGLFDAAPVNSPIQIVSQFGLSEGTLWPFMLPESKLFRRGNLTPFDTNKWLEVTGTLVPTGLRKWSWTSGEDHLFFCRGNDTVMEWDGNPANQFDLIANDPQFEPVDGAVGVMSAARFMEYFAERLVLANVVEAGTTFVNRLRWSKRADYRKWDSTLGLGAGFLDIPTEHSQPINGMKALGDRLAVYSQSSIIDVVETGQIDPTFVYKVRARGIGLIAPYTLGKANQVHFFLGKDFNVWAWDGVQPQPIGDPVWQEIQALAHLDTVNEYFGFVAHKRSEYWLVLSDQGRGTYEAFIFDYRTNSWSRDTFPSLTAADEIEVTLGALTWDSLIGTWGEQTQTWEQLGGTTQSAIVGGRPDGSTMLIDDGFSYDYFAVGSIMDCILETEDHYLPGEDAVWKNQEILRVLLVYNPAFSGGDPIEVGVSFNQGSSWDVQNVTLDSTGYAYVDFVKTGRVVRYRFRESDANVQFRYRGYGYQYVVSGDANPGT